MLEADIRVTQGGFVLDAQFRAPADVVTALFGPSGAGKSTLLAALAGLKKLDAGRIALMGRVCAGEGVHVPAHQRGFGLVFQDARLFPNLSARQNILYAARRAPAGGARLEQLAEFFDITALLDRPVGNFSGGEKSRVALARALASHPDYLLLDEPFAALDGARRRSFIAVLLAAHREYRLPMMVVTHNIDDAAALASHMVALAGGRVAAQGAFAAVAQSREFQALLDRHDIGALLSPGGDTQTAHGYWLRADQVLLAGEKPRSISARNILEGQVSSVAVEDEGSVLVGLATQAGAVLARVTADAARELSLTPGKPAFALAKAHAFGQAGPLAL